MTAAMVCLRVGRHPSRAGGFDSFAADMTFTLPKSPTSFGR
jgi:hypothetical protein